MWGVMFRFAMALTVFAIAFVSPASAAWQEARTRNFVVYSEGSAKQLKELAEKLEKFDFLLRSMTGAPDQEMVRPLQVYALRSAAEVSSLSKNRSVAGFYSVSRSHAYAVIAREAKDSKFDLGAEEILFHEYTHHFMLHHFPAAYPAWYVEGFAEFFSNVKFTSKGTIEFGHIPMARVPGLALMPIYPLGKLLVQSTDEVRLDERDRYYGTAWLLTHYLHYIPQRRKEFDAYLAAVTRGDANVSPDTYFSGGVVQLEKDLKAYLARRKIAATQFTPQAMPEMSIAIVPLDPARSALLRLDLELLRGIEMDGRARFVAQVRSASARHPNSAFAQELLADAEYVSDNFDAALSAADRAVLADAKSARALGLRGRILLDRAHASGTDADWKAALSSIVRANRADTEDPWPLALFHQYHAKRGGQMPHIAYDGLMKAFALLPQNADYRFRLASALANKKEFAQAAKLMEPLAFSPHESGMRQAAMAMRQTFLEAAKGGAAANMTFLTEDNEDASKGDE